MRALPSIRLGSHTVSRLIVGGNPVSGNSHISREANREMRDYFSAANVKKLLSSCEKAGINTWLSRGDAHILRLLNEYRLEGGRIQWIAQTAPELADVPRHIRALAAAKPIGIYHQAGQSDNFFKAGKMEVVRERCALIRETGVLVGIGTHTPEVIDYVESKAWDFDFYMACVYNIHNTSHMNRTKEEREVLAGHQLDRELFWDPDREKMLARVRQTKKPCLIFKVYGASRKCGSPEQMLEALRLVARYAKSTDAVVIGMFPKHKEQVNENCRLLMQAVASEGAA